MWEQEHITNKCTKSGKHMKEKRRSMQSDKQICTHIHNHLNFTRDLSRRYEWIQKKRFVVQCPLLLCLCPHCSECMCTYECVAAQSWLHQSSYVKLNWVLQKANVTKIWAGWTVFTLWGVLPISPLTVLLLPWTSLFWVLTHANSTCRYWEIAQIFWKGLETRLENKRQNKWID